MEINVEKMDYEKTELKIKVSNGKEFNLTIEFTGYSHTYEDFTEWDITDKEYYYLEDQVDLYISQMRMLAGTY